MKNKNFFGRTKVPYFSLRTQGKVAYQTPKVLGTVRKALLLANASPCLYKWDNLPKFYSFDKDLNRTFPTTLGFRNCPKPLNHNRCCCLLLKSQINSGASGKLTPFEDGDKVIEKQDLGFTNETVLFQESNLDNSKVLQTPKMSSHKKKRISTELVSRFFIKGQDRFLSGTTNYHYNNGSGTADKIAFGEIGRTKVSPFFYPTFLLAVRRKQGEETEIGQYQEAAKQTPSFKKYKKGYSSYSKLQEINEINIGLASPERIRKWAEKILPNNKTMGRVTNANTLHYKTFKPQKGGLFCERIFGPLKDFECACGKKQKALSKTGDTKPFTSEGVLKQSPNRQYCPECDVEYTWSVIRRYQLGYIQLIAPVTHLWYLKGTPSYLSLLLNIKRKDLESIIYCSESMTLEAAWNLKSLFSQTPKDLFLSWQKMVKTKSFSEEKDQKLGLLRTNFPESSSHVGNTNLSSLNTNIKISVNNNSGKTVNDVFDPTKIGAIINMDPSFKPNLSDKNISFSFSKIDLQSNSTSSLLAYSKILQKSEESHNNNAGNYVWQNLSTRLASGKLTPLMLGKASVSKNLEIYRHQKQALLFSREATAKSARYFLLEGKIPSYNMRGPVRVKNWRSSLPFSEKIDYNFKKKSLKYHILTKSNNIVGLPFQKMSYQLRKNQNLTSKMLPSVGISIPLYLFTKFGRISQKKAILLFIQKIWSTFYKKSFLLARRKAIQILKHAQIVIGNKTLPLPLYQRCKGKLLSENHINHTISSKTLSLFSVSTNIDKIKRDFKKHLLLSFYKWNLSNLFFSQALDPNVRDAHQFWFLPSYYIHQRYKGKQQNYHNNYGDNDRNSGNDNNESADHLKKKVDSLNNNNSGRQILMYQKQDTELMSSLMVTYLSQDLLKLKGVRFLIQRLSSELANKLIKGYLTIFVSSHELAPLSSKIKKEDAFFNISQNYIKHSLQSRKVLSFLALINRNSSLLPSYYIQGSSKQGIDKKVFYNKMGFFFGATFLKHTKAKFRFFSLLRTVLMNKRIKRLSSLKGLKDSREMVKVNSFKNVNFVKFLMKKGGEKSHFLGFNIKNDNNNWSNCRYSKAITKLQKMREGYWNKYYYFKLKNLRSYYTGLVSQNINLTNKLVKTNESFSPNTFGEYNNRESASKSKPSIKNEETSTTFEFSRAKAKVSDENVVNNTNVMPNRLDNSNASLLVPKRVYNNLYVLPYTLNWKREKDWRSFSCYVTASLDYEDIPIFEYQNRIPNSESPTFVGAGVIQKLLEEFHVEELKKMDKQNRICLYELTKEIDPLKKFIRLGLADKSDELRYKEIFKERDKLIRRLKLTRVLYQKKSNPLSMILLTLPVLPPDLRPIIKMEGQIAASDLNRFYQRILYRNERLQKFLKDPATRYSYEMKFTQRLLQESVDNLISNGKGKVSAEKDSRGRPLKSLSDILKGKEGRFRQHLLGKRVDYSGRSVIVVGPKLKIHECGLPVEMAVELFLPFLLKRLIHSKMARTVIGAKTLLQTNPILTFEILKEVIQNHPILLNRAPTLHRLGIQAFQPKLVEGRAILLHPLVCPAFNADFDGDQMAVHVPITVEARAEAWKLMFSRTNLLSPATGDPILLPSQDMVLGCYYLTTENVQKNYNRQLPYNYNSYNNYNRYYSLLTTPNEKSNPIMIMESLAEKSSIYFSHIRQVLKAYYQGTLPQKLDLHSSIWLKYYDVDYNDYGLLAKASHNHYKNKYGRYPFENDGQNELPVEIRISLYGYYQEIYPKIQHRFDPNHQLISRYIRTTVGRLILNVIIQDCINC